MANRFEAIRYGRDDPSAWYKTCGDSKHRQVEAARGDLTVRDGDIICIYDGKPIAVLDEHEYGAAYAAFRRPSKPTPDEMLPL